MYVFMYICTCLYSTQHTHTHNTAAHSCTGLHNQTDNLLLYQKTVFCLTPPGDSLTRKSLFDSLLSGCIPVVFATATVNQYFWHITAEDVDRVSIYIPGQSILEQGVNFLDVLRAIPYAKIREMQASIEQLAPTLQYSVVPEGFGTLYVVRCTLYVVHVVRLRRKRGRGGI